MLNCRSTLSLPVELLLCGVAAVTDGLCSILGHPLVTVQVFPLLLAGLCSPGQGSVGLGSALTPLPSGLEASGCSFSTSGCPASKVPAIVIVAAGVINTNHAAGPELCQQFLHARRANSVPGQGTTRREKSLARFSGQQLICSGPSGCLSPVLLMWHSVLQALYVTSSKIAWQ